MLSLVVIGQQIKEKRWGTPSAYILAKYPSLNRVKDGVKVIPLVFSKLPFRN